MSISYLPSLYRHRDLLFAWTSRILRARYQQTVLGSLWAIIQPLTGVAIFTIIFTRFVPVDTGGIPYVVFSFTAMVPWTFFAASVQDMVNSLVDNTNLVSKIYFPREILPLAATMARLLDYAISLALLIVLLVYYKMPFSPGNWLFVPLILLIQVAFMLGLGLAGAAVNVFFRDTKHLIGLILQIWLYATPIIYPVTVVPERLRPFYFLNPMAGILEAYRAVMLYGRAPDATLLTAACLAFVVLVVGYAFFKRVEFQFADVV